MKTQILFFSEEDANDFIRQCEKQRDNVDFLYKEGKINNERTTHLKEKLFHRITKAKKYLFGKNFSLSKKNVL